MIPAIRARFPFRAILPVVFVPLLFHAAIVTIGDARVTLTPGGIVRTGAVIASAMMHWAIYAGLLASFAATLRPGHRPLITAIASREYASKPYGAAMPGELVSYTRRVTIAWCCFFAAQLTTSVLLFFLAPLAAWSFFVNVLDIPLVIAMYAAEYAVRIRVLRDPPRQSIAAIVAMVSDCVKGRSPAASVD
jgi:uncharacterized membrane protein